MSTVNNESFDRVTASARSYKSCLVPQTEAYTSVGHTYRDFGILKAEYSAGYNIISVRIPMPVK